jgi:methionine-rich copper-binding protein CopC
MSAYQPQPESRSSSSRSEEQEMTIGVTTMTPYASGFFSKGWNLIAQDGQEWPGALVFYNALTGAGATGNGTNGAGAIVTVDA